MHDLDIKGAIFDVDGTLLDSMPVWHGCGVRFLAKQGIHADPSLGDLLFTQTSDTAARYMIDEFGLDMTPEEVSEGLDKEMEDFYLNEVQPKEGAIELLDMLHSGNVPAAVATSTAKRLIKAAFERLDMMKYFDAIVTCPEVGATKAKPDVFNEAARRIGVTVEDTWVFEDGMYAIKTAVNAGFHTVAVYDEISRSDWKNMRELAEESCESLADFEERIEYGR